MNVPPAFRREGENVYCCAQLFFPSLPQENMASSVTALHLQIISIHSSTTVPHDTYKPKKRVMVKRPNTFFGMLNRKNWEHLVGNND